MDDATGAAEGAPRSKLGSDFWRFWTGQTVSNLGSSFTLFALPLLVYELTGSALNLAITTVSEFVPYLLFGLVIGAWVDRLDRKRLMIVVDILRAGFITTIPLLALAGNLEVWWIYTVGFANSTLNIFFDAAQFAAIPSIVDQDDLVTANGRIQASFSGAQIAGPVVAGALAATFPIAQVLYFDALTFIVSAISLVMVRAPFNEAEGDGARKSLRTDIAEGLQFVLTNPVLRNISLMMALYNFVAATQWTQLVLFADVRLDATRAQIGLLFGAASAGIMVLGLLAGWFRKRWSFSTVALGALAMNGLLHLLFARSTDFWVALPLWGLANGFGILFNIQTISLRQLIVPNRMLGRVMSIAGVLAWSAIPAGAFIGGLVIEETGNVALVYTAIAAMTLAIPLIFRFTALGSADDFLPKAEPGASEQVDEPPLSN